MMRQTNTCSVSLAWGRLITLGRAIIMGHKNNPTPLGMGPSLGEVNTSPINSRCLARRIVGLDLLANVLASLNSKQDFN
jgi:hypothetical protein